MNVICFGDSNTFGYDPTSRAGEPYDETVRWVDILRKNTGWNVVNQGVNGREIPTEPVDFPQNTDLLLVMLGTNDLLQLSAPEDAAQRMEEFLRTVKLPPWNILLIAPPRMKPGAWVADDSLIEDSVELNRLLEGVADRCGVRFLDAGMWNIGLGYDGVHFSEEGSRQFGKILSGYLLRRAELFQKFPDAAVTVDYMRRCDEATIATTTPSLELMYRAAEGVYHAMVRRFYEIRGNVAILAGSGNNGGDGFALACILKERTICDPTVYTLSEKRSPDSDFYARLAAEAGIRILPFDPQKHNLQICDYVVDCLLGTGFSGMPRDNYRMAIETMNRSPAFKISVDINSGMNGDTGEGECVVNSELTVSIGMLKRGQRTETAKQHMKMLVCADIGIRHLSYKELFYEGHAGIRFDADRSFDCPMKNYTGTIYGME